MNRANDFLDSKPLQAITERSYANSDAQSDARSNVTGASRASNFTQGNKSSLDNYRRLGKQMKCDTLPQDQKDKIDQMEREIEDNLDAIQDEKKEYYKQINGS